MTTYMPVIVWAAGTLISAFVGSWLAGYLRKKGEGVAAHEDISKLVDEVSAVTTATKEIEKKIDRQIWSGQRQWELKRDALLAAVSALRHAQIAVGSLYSAYDVDMKVKGKEWEERAPEERRRASEALAVFDEKRFEASLVCSKIVNSAMATPASLMRYCIKFFAQEEHKKGSDLVPRINDAVNLAIDFMRKELGFTPLSSESSVTPTLAQLNRSEES